MIALEVHRHELTHPATETPRWAERVDRWYQLDAFAYGLAESYDRLPALHGERPALLILASPGASNATDRAFVRAPSPARFVHTLPSVRSSALCQAMGWAGPMLCLQRDPHTIGAALSEAAALRTGSPIWVASVIAHEGGYRAYWSVLPADGRPTRFALHREVAPVHEDRYLIEIFDRQISETGAAGQKLGMPGGFTLRERGSETR